MNCETARQLWNDACDDEISAARRSELDGHLRSCTACAKYVRQMEAIVGGLDVLRIESARLPARVPPADQRGTARRGLRWVGAIAAVVALAITARLVQQVRQIGSSPGNIVTPQVVHSEPAVAPVQAKVTMTGPDAQDFLAAQGRSSNPKVHFFQVYRVRRPEKEESRMPVPTGEAYVLNTQVDSNPTPIQIGG